MKWWNFARHLLLTRIEFDTHGSRLLSTWVLVTDTSIRFRSKRPYPVSRAVSRRSCSKAGYFTFLVHQVGLDGAVDVESVRVETEYVLANDCRR